MEEIDIKIAQSEALAIYKKVKYICNEIGITCFSMYGTTLGTVRHHGFIPWDDDLDLGMFIDDYKEFINYFKKNNNQVMGLSLSNCDTDSKCFFNITRVCDESNYICEFDDYIYKSGIFIDIYPVEGLGNDGDKDYWMRRFKKYHNHVKQVSLACSIGFLHGKDSLHKILNFPVVVYSKIKGRNSALRWFDDRKQFELDQSTYVGVPKWEITYYRKEWFDEFIELAFEDTTMSVPKGYKDILTKSYGDYMKLPSKEKRVPSHGYSVISK